LFSAPALFFGGICFAGAYRSGETLLISSDRRQLRVISSRGNDLLFLPVPENDSLFLSRHRIAGMGAYMDCATVLFFCDPIHHRLLPMASRSIDQSVVSVYVPEV